MVQTTFDIEGITLGVQDLAEGVLKGMEGLIAHPAQGVVNEGAPGLATGFARGLVG